ncbi:sensor histidine kinase [Neobacillus sp. NPDC093127]|uniref:sensor histidine kinase n=1 Tax=Neobacillus sp. NPDC093127 TaxID=3364296 RepID=UPI003825FD80
MSKVLLKNFFKDKKSIILVYLINTAILIIFFNIIHPGNLEILYPISISLFVLAILIVMEWSTYYKFNHHLHQSNHDRLDLRPVTNEQAEVSQLIHTLNKKYVREINELKSTHEENVQFLYQWMHNLKTPISVIELIIQKYSAQQTFPVEVLKNIKAENDSLFASIEQVLNMIRFENIAMDFEPRAVALVASVKTVINEKKSQFIYNHVYPVVNANLEYSVITDKKWNQFLLDQLISNAIKYSDTSESNKKLVITIFQEKEYTCLSIKDEGVGIPAYDLPRVFDPFFTGENGRKFRNSTGIGLYICKKIADRLGHRLEISSEVGKGTEVTIKYLAKL